MTAFLYQRSTMGLLTRRAEHARASGSRLTDRLRARSSRPAGACALAHPPLRGGVGVGVVPPGERLGRGLTTGRAKNGTHRAPTCRPPPGSPSASPPLPARAEGRCASSLAPWRVAPQHEGRFKLENACGGWALPVRERTLGQCRVRRRRGGRAESGAGRVAGGDRQPAARDAGHRRRDGEGGHAGERAAGQSRHRGRPAPRLCGQPFRARDAGGGGGVPARPSRPHRRARRGEGARSGE